MPFMIDRRFRSPLLGAAVVLAAVVFVLVATAPSNPPHSIVIGEPIPALLIPHQNPGYLYFEVADSCGPQYQGGCVVARSGPGTQYPIVMRLRSGMVLRVADSKEADGRTWYRVGFDEWLRFPDRARSLWVAADMVASTYAPGPESLGTTTKATAKRIIIDRGRQMLYAYEGDTIFMEEHVSTGLLATPTPRGTFEIFEKTPTRYMQGPIPGISDDYYDLPGVPWDLYFTEQGAAIHGAYWHDEFGEPHSHGCVNLPVALAKKLYDWAELGTPVIVRD